MKTMTIYGPNGEPLEARKKDFFISVKSEKEVCLVCQCNDPLAMAWYVKYIGPGYYHGVCPYCQTEIGIEKPDKYAKLYRGRRKRTISVLQFFDRRRAMNVIKRLAYKIVFNDLKKINMYCGVYDAKNGKPDFMYGIWGIMQHIAYKADERRVDEFDGLFSDNMDMSEEKAKRRSDED